MHMRYSRSNAATIAACLRKKASNDDRLLRFRFRNHFGSAEFHCDSRREGEAAERPVRGEDSGFRQNKAAFGERHRINHHAVAAAGAQYRTRRRYARAGHTTTSKVFASDWQPAGEATLNATDPAVDSMDALWESLCSQVILDDPSPIDVNTRLARRMQIAQLTAQVDKLTRDHQRAKNPEQRNEIYAKLHKTKRQLEELQGQ